MEATLSERYKKASRIVTFQSLYTFFLTPFLVIVPFFALFPALHTMFYPACHLDNFKPWIPPRIKSLNSSNSKPNISSSFKTHKPSDSDRSSNPLLAPRTQVLGHPLSARPPAEVCVRTTTDARSDIPSISRSQPRESSEPPSDTSRAWIFLKRVSVKFRLAIKTKPARNGQASQIEGAQIGVN